MRHPIPIHISLCRRLPRVPHLRLGLPASTPPPAAPAAPPPSAAPTSSRDGASATTTTPSFPAAREQRRESRRGTQRAHSAHTARTQHTFSTQTRAAGQSASPAGPARGAPPGGCFPVASGPMACPRSARHKRLPARDRACAGRSSVASICAEPLCPAHRAAAARRGPCWRRRRKGNAESTTSLEQAARQHWTRLRALRHRAHGIYFQVRTALAAPPCCAAPRVRGPACRAQRETRASAGRARAGAVDSSCRVTRRCSAAGSRGSESVVRSWGGDGGRRTPMRFAPTFSCRRHVHTVREEGSSFGDVLCNEKKLWGARPPKHEQPGVREGGGAR